MRVVFALVFAVGWIGCTISSDFTGTQYTCNDGRCPPGFRCVEKRCVDGDGGPRDAAAEPDAILDAMTDAMIDAPTCTFEPRSDSCAPADLEELTAVAQAGGQTVCGSTTGNTNALLGCAGAPLPGLDAVFRFSATAGQQVTATLRPMGFNGAVYLLTDCSGQCLDLADDLGVGGTETAQVTAATSGDHYVVVDSGSGAGAFELVVAVQ